MESSCVNAHDKLKEVYNLQTHFRLREAQGKVFADGLNSRVQVYYAVIT